MATRATAGLPRGAAAAARSGLAMLAAAVTALASASVAAQTGRSGLIIEPTFGARVTAVDVRGERGGREGGELIGAITPGLRVSSRTGRVQGLVDYGLTAVAYSRDSRDSGVQNRLGANLRAELVPNHLDVELLGSIARQPTSILGRQSADGSLTRDNQSEVRSYTIRPVLRGVLGGVVAVQASAAAAYTNASTRGFGSNSQSAAVTASSAGPGTVIGWAVTASRQVTDFDGGRKTTGDRLTGSITVRPDVDWLLSFRGGGERTDIAAIQTRHYENWGAGVRWTPSPRTSVSIDGDRRFFGDAYAVSMQHRSRRTVWSYSGSRSAAQNTGQGVVPVRAYDLFFELLASQEPDPVLRDLLVRSVLERNGIAPEAIIGGLGFLTSATSLQERHQIGMAVSGVRTTFTGTLSTSRSERLDTVSGAIDDLFAGAVRQHGLSLGLGHRLTPRDSLTLSFSASHTRPVDDRPDTDLYSLALSWRTRLSESSALSVSARHSRFDREGSAGYTENAVTAAFSTRF